MKSYPVISGNDFIENELRIPSLNNQDSMESKQPGFVVVVVVVVVVVRVSTHLIHILRQNGSLPLKGMKGT